MIEIKDKYIHLKNESESLIIKIREDGKLELVHLGRAVELSDASALLEDPGLGWGASVLYKEGDFSSCLSSLPLFYSELGRGDYRESPIEIFKDERPYTADFIFEKAEELKAEDLALEALNSVLPLAHNALGAVRIVCKSKICGLKLVHTIKLFETALTFRTALINDDDQVFELSKLASLLADLPGEFEMHNFSGGWISETHHSKTAVHSARVVNESRFGFSGNEKNAGTLFARKDAGEDHGEVYGLNLIYSGNHYTSACKSKEGLTRIVCGINPENFTKILKKGESFETPEAVLAYSFDGFNGLRKNMHKFVLNCVIPAQWNKKVRPIVYNSWEGCMFDFNESKLLDLARRAKKLGCETFVLDDGWFGKRNDDTKGLGDYSVNTKKLRSGLAGFSDKLKNSGLDFGLWFEPEAVNPNSDLYKNHPDWAIHQEKLPDLYGRNELLLDLRKAEVRDYIVENVGRIIDEAGVSYVKWDMNRESPLIGLSAHEYILGLYDVLRRIFGPRPEVLLESCSSGGNRFDLGMLSFGPQIWSSDDTDPVERLDIQRGLSYLYPQSCMGAHVSASPHAQTLRATPLSTRFNVAAFGILGYELDLRYLVPAEEKEIKDQIEYYKLHRKLLQFGQFSIVENDYFESWQVLGETKADGNEISELSDGNKAEETLEAAETHKTCETQENQEPQEVQAAQEAQEAIVGIFHRLCHAAPGYEYLKANLPKGSYSIESKAQALRVGMFGGLLKHVTPIELNPDGLIIDIADKNYRMQDAVYKASASADALSSGLPLPNLFLGTGYSDKMRTQSDFGSNLFYIKSI